MNPDKVKKIGFAALGVWVLLAGGLGYLAYDAASSRTEAEETLEEVRQTYREAQWYFDFCYVENSEGAHNSELAYRCLDTSEQMIAEGMEKLGK